MKHLVTLIAAAAAATIAVAAPASAQRAPIYASDEEARFDAAQQRFEREYDQFQQALERYRAYKSRPVGPPPPPRGGYSGGGYDPRDDEYYDASRDYRAPPPGYQERVLTQDDRVYRGNDGKYYCRRSDGTTGLIVGAAAGGLFGNIIAGGRSKTVGTLLGAVAGGALGSAADRDTVRCR